ncbi:hypothetical protein L7F22_025620 [Adiantum nelumboides]|nr:hypothetical protein [Adiantum nelumboides]
MSATLGDTSFFAEDLTRRTGRETAEITSVERPVPLHFRYVLTPLHETITELLPTHEAPVYVVHFTQQAAVERAQALMSVNVTSKEDKAAIAETIGAFRFTSGFGRTLSRLVRHGIGVHHAGMLPRYRRLVETLAQAGLLKVICGTDTLGVGINVPIRTVLFTALTKYDGRRERPLKAREFHQIAGRAGRAGYDTVGTVVAQAPEHAIENAKALAKAGDDPKKRRKVQRKKPPEGFVGWSETSFEKLQQARPEPLTSHFQVTFAMLLNVISRGGDTFAAMKHLLADNHEPRKRQLKHMLRAIAIYRALRTSGVVEQYTVDGATRPRARVVDELQLDFALNQPLSPFALAAVELLDTEADLRPRRAVGDRGDPGRPAPGAGRPAEQGPRRGDRLDEGRGHRVRGADGAPGGRHLPQAARRAAARRAGDLPPWRAVGGGRPPVAQVGRPRHVREGDDVHRVRLALPARPLRGPGAALPGRRLPGAAPDRARARPHRGAHRPRGVAGRAGPPDRLLAARRVGEARRRGGCRRGGAAAGGRGRRRHADRGHRQRPRVPGHGAQRAVPPGGARGDGPLRRAGRSRRRRRLDRRPLAGRPGPLLRDPRPDRLRAGRARARAVRPHRGDRPLAGAPGPRRPGRRPGLGDHRRGGPRRLRRGR